MIGQAKFPGKLRLSSLGAFCFRFAFLPPCLACFALEAIAQALTDNSDVVVHLAVCVSYATVAFLFYGLLASVCSFFVGSDGILVDFSPT